MQIIATRGPVAANTGPELQINTGLRVESRHVVDTHCSWGTSEPDSTLACTTVPYMRLGAFSIGASRARLQNVVVLPCSSSFSYTPSNLLDNGHKHRKVATLSNLAVLFSAFASLFQENLVPWYTP